MFDNCTIAIKNHLSVPLRFSFLVCYNYHMFKSLQNMHYKSLLLYGFYGSYIVLNLVATIIDFFIQNYSDALIEITAMGVAVIMFRIYLKHKNEELASIVFMWMSTLVIFTFIINNEFHISIIFSLLIPLIAFILFSRKMIILHLLLYFFALSMVFIYGYMRFDNHPFLYDVPSMSAYIISLLFILAFGAFYHIAIEHSYREIEEANRQKTFLLKEVHHRVKNNLNIIASILGLQKFESSSKEVHELIDQNRLRLESIAMAHEILYACDNVANIEFKEYVTKLSSHILHAESRGHEIEVKIEVVTLKLSIENMVQFGLMINELMTNSLKYAFPKNRGCISIGLKEEDEEFIFFYGDDGEGIDLDTFQKGFGFSLIEMASKQLDGLLEIDHTHGLRYKIRLKGLKG